MTPAPRPPSSSPLPPFFFRFLPLPCPNEAAALAFFAELEDASGKEALGDW